MKNIYCLYNLFENYIDRKMKGEDQNNGYQAAAIFCADRGRGKHHRGGPELTHVSAAAEHADEAAGGRAGRDAV